MRRVFLTILLGLGTITAFSQTAAYKLQAGETVMRLDVEKRGSILIRLFTNEAPKTTEQIMRLVQTGFYDNQRFHKVERSPKPFLIQIGAPGSRSKSIDDPELLKEGSGKQLAYENSGFANDQEGMVGLSTQPKNRDSGDSQFYILLGPARFLDGNYTVFGKVVSGLDVLRKIEKGDRISSAAIIRG